MNLPKYLLNFRKIGKLFFLFSFGIFLWNLLVNIFFTNEDTHSISHFSAAAFVVNFTTLLFPFRQLRPEENTQLQKIQIH